MISRIFVTIFVLAMLIACESMGSPFADFGSPQQTASSQKSVPASSASSPATLSDRWKPETIDTAVTAAYLSSAERRVIREINMVRTDPAQYARSFLVPLRSYFHGKLLRYPEEIGIMTSEGAAALEECIKALESARPVPPLSPKEGLYRAARDHAVDQAKTGAVGHSGSDGSTPVTRLNRYGRWDITMGENVDYGNADARRIVTSLLVDDGVPSRGHRTNLLNPQFKVVGIAVGPHPVYGHMCVMDFAGAYN